MRILNCKRILLKEHRTDKRKYYCILVRYNLTMLIIFTIFLSSLIPIINNLDHLYSPEVNSFLPLQNCMLDPPVSCTQYAVTKLQLFI